MELGKEKQIILLSHIENVHQRIQNNLSDQFKNLRESLINTSN
jgi:hypothetical protein